MLTVLAVCASGTTHAFGETGHRVAGEIAASLLCDAARAGVARYGEGRDLGELGLWADRIRSSPAWEHSAPWHYMNIADAERFDTYRTPPEGDVLWAIEHFGRRLGDTSLEFRGRAEALRFLVHFVVDIHQPLHVGRIEDRGGNLLTISVGGETTNLHRLWDSGIIAMRRESLAGYRAAIASLARAQGEDWKASTPRDWAAESRSLRSFVYAYESDPDATYLGQADAIVRRRLAQAAVRLAAVLNARFCPEG